MVVHWKRRFEIDVAGMHLKLDDLQVEVQIRLAEVEHPDWAYVRIINLGPTSNAIFKPSVPIQIHGGYHKGPYGMLFDGTVRDMRRGKLNGTDTYHDIIAQSGSTSYTYAAVNGKVESGKTLYDVADLALKEMEKLGVKRGYIDPSLASKKLDRGWTINTEARNVMRQIANSTDTSWIIENNEVRIVSNSQGLPGGGPGISAETGMIGIPEQQLFGVVVRVLMNSGYRLQQRIRIDPNVINRYIFVGPTVTKRPLNQSRPYEIGDNLSGPYTGGGAVVPLLPSDGIYRIIRIDHDGQMRGQPWYTTLTCLDPNHPGSAGAPVRVSGITETESGRDIPESDKAGSVTGGP